MQRLKLIFILILLVETVFCEVSVSQAFENAGLVPYPIKVAPTRFVKVVYPGGIVVKLGNQLNALQIAAKPKASFDVHDDSYYTLLMIDPDALYPNFLNLPQEYFHWGVGNIRGGDVNSGDEFAFYLLPTPPPFSRPHRYTFVVYRQPGYIHYRVTLNTTFRPVFDTQAFLDKHRLGNAVFGNYFNGSLLG